MSEDGLIDYTRPIESTWGVIAKYVGYISGEGLDEWWIVDVGDETFKVDGNGIHPVSRRQIVRNVPTHEQRKDERMILDIRFIEHQNGKRDLQVLESAPDCGDSWGGQDISTEPGGWRTVKTLRYGEWELDADGEPQPVKGSPR